MKKIIIKSCLEGCPYFVHMDDPPHYCKYNDGEFDFSDEEWQRQIKTFIWEGCELEEYFDDNQYFDEWIERYYSHVKREWKLFLETLDPDDNRRVGNPSFKRMVSPPENDELLK